MKLFHFPLLLGAALALPNVGAHAQTAATTNAPAVAPDQLVTTEIPLRNVQSSVMAYWLDPAHQPMPLSIQASIASSGKVPLANQISPRANSLPVAPAAKPMQLRPGNGSGPLNFQLPAGIASVESVESQNVLRVRGTQASVNQLLALVTQLDVPLQQAEIEVRFCEIAPDDLKNFGLLLNPDKAEEKAVFETPAPFAQKQNPLSIGYIEGNFQAKLDALLAQNKAKIITAPRVTAINGLTAKLTSSEPRMLTSRVPEEWLAADWVGEPTKNQIYPFATDTTETSLTCTPLIYKDWIKLDLETEVQGRSLNFTATLKDGEVLAASFPSNDANAKMLTVVFITARVVKRGGE